MPEGLSPQAPEFVKLSKKCKDITPLWRNKSDINCVPPSRQPFGKVSVIEATDLPLGILTNAKPKLLEAPEPDDPSLPPAPPASWPLDGNDPTNWATWQRARLARKIASDNASVLHWWWFQIFLIVIPIWVRFPWWLIFFRWVETTNQYYICVFERWHVLKPFSRCDSSRLLTARFQASRKKLSHVTLVMSFMDSINVFSWF